MMRRMMVVTVMAALAAGVGGTAQAVDRTGYQAIATGDLASAERRLIAERRIFPQRPELMLNLAAVYARTERATEANALYDATLAAPAVDLDLADGRIATSHDVARAGQRALSNAQVAVR